jgi:hypothetical protein
MTDLPDAFPKSASIWGRIRLDLILLLGLHSIICCVSLMCVAEYYPDIIAFDSRHLFAAVLLAATFFGVVSWVFATAQFSFGYFLGFYFYTMILGYLWLINFSRLPYDHGLAIISIFLSALAFIAPALMITSPIRHRLALSERGFETLLSLLLVLATATVVVGALYSFKPVALSEMYKFRAGLEFPAPLRYLISMMPGAVLPFAFACFVERGYRWRAGLSLLLILLLYPVALTKLTLFAPCWLVFLMILSRLFETRMSIILSLLLPISAGVAWELASRSSSLSLPLMQQYVVVINSRMIAMPSVALEVYNNFFSTHDLTHFCQINILKPLIGCPYSEPLSVVMQKSYAYGFFNASLFATEGIASVGPVLAPLSALGCGLAIALGNRLSSGLPPRFILLSGGVLPQIFLNVPLSTTLVTNGAATLFLLWYITPRTMFAAASAERASSAAT